MFALNRSSAALRPDELNQMKVSASMKIGLDPHQYLGKVIDVYQYQQEELGIERNLRAEGWFFQNKAVCAYLFHAEPNKKLHYWPLNVSITEIQADLAK
jgi:hypothetical protein